MSIETVYILCGLPGSGKTTWVEGFTRNFDPRDLFIYSTDDLIERWAKEQEKTYSEIWEKSIKDATTEMNERLEEAKKTKKFIVWDQTNLSRKKRNRIVQKFPTASILYVCFKVSSKTLHHRLSNRPGKVIPQQILEKMIESFEIPGMDTNEQPVIYVGDF